MVAAAKAYSVAEQSAKLPGTITLLARAIMQAERASDRAIAQAKLLLLDTIGCGLAGAEEPAAAAVLEAVSASEKSGAGPIIGTDKKFGALGVVLANGALVRVLDLNDYIIGESNGEPESGGHPSAPVL